MKVLVAGVNHKEFRFQVEHQGSNYFLTIAKPQIPPKNVAAWLETQLQESLKNAKLAEDYNTYLKSMVGITVADVGAP